MLRAFPTPAERVLSMKTVSEPSFEILHIVSTLIVSFFAIFERCKLDVEQLYILAYIKSHGQLNRRGQRVILRENITKVLKVVFGCNDSQISGWVGELCTGEFLDETTLKDNEKAELFSTNKGRNKALFIKRKGVAKVGSLTRELEKLLDETIKPNSRFFLAPGSDSPGIVGATLSFFLSAAKAEAQSRELSKSKTSGS